MMDKNQKGSQPVKKQPAAPAKGQTGKQGLSTNKNMGKKTTAPAAKKAPTQPGKGTKK